MWEYSNYQSLPPIQPYHSPLLLLREWQACLNWSDFEEVVVLIWELWIWRNDKVFNLGRWKKVLDLPAWAHDYIFEYGAANVNPLPRFQASDIVHWHPPAEGLYKINTDASFYVTNLQAGLGIVIRNHRGQVMATATKYLDYVHSIDVAEALAAAEGLQLAAEIGVHPVILETDSSRVFNLFSNPLEDLSETSEIVLQARRLSTNLLHATFSFVKRDECGGSPACEAWSPIAAKFRLD